jgi:hypothetical protein
MNKKTMAGRGCKLRDEFDCWGMGGGRCNR